MISIKAAKFLPQELVCRSTEERLLVISVVVIVLQVRFSALPLMAG